MQRVQGGERCKEQRDGGRLNATLGLGLENILFIPNQEFFVIF